MKMFAPLTMALSLVLSVLSSVSVSGISYMEPFPVQDSAIWGEVVYTAQQCLAEKIFEPVEQMRKLDMAMTASTSATSGTESVKTDESNSMIKSFDDEENADSVAVVTANPLNSQDKTTTVIPPIKELDCFYKVSLCVCVCFFVWGVLLGFCLPSLNFSEQ